MKTWIKIQLLIILLLAGYGHRKAYAQVDKLMEAFDCYQNKDFACAKNKIDEVILHPETKEEPLAWSLRAHIYYQYFKNYEYTLYNSKYRTEAINSAQTSQTLSPDAETENSNKRLIKAVAESYFNQIKIYLYDSLNYNVCVELYQNFKKTLTLVEPNTNFKEKDIEFYLSIGGEYTTQIKKMLDYKADDFAKVSDKCNQYLEITKLSFNKVLEIDPNNIKALEGLAIVYYNQGAKLVKEISIDTPLDQMDQMQENANRYFKQALPYMQKAYESKPEDPKIVEGMVGIYWALHDYEKHKEFNKKLEQLKKKPEQK